MPVAYDKDFIKIYRIKRGYTMEFVAEKVNMSRQRYSRIESDPGKADFDVIIDILKVLEVPLDKVVFFN